MDGYKDWRDIDPHEFLTRHSGARAEPANRNRYPLPFRRSPQSARRE
jgi:hypothetical protein